MSFADTYREERLINRRARARAARIIGRVIGFCLTACFVVALRVEPQLRAVVTDLALVVLGRTAEQSISVPEQQAEATPSPGSPPGSAEAQALDRLAVSGEKRQGIPVINRMPQSRVKVNRPGSN